MPVSHLSDMYDYSISHQNTTRPSIMTTLYALWGMSRPIIMLSVILVYFAGAIAVWSRGAAIDLPALWWGLITVTIMVASIHYANEYADYETDALTQRTPFSGGSGILAKNLVPRRLALQAAWIALLIGSGLALSGWLLEFFSAASILVLAIGTAGGWMYSLPPLKLAWRGWGELDNATLGGLVLTTYAASVQVGHVDFAAAAGWLPFSLLAFTNLLATTWADRHADARAGKLTLATRYPASLLRRLHLLVVLAAFGLMPLLLAADILTWPIMVAGLSVLPLALYSSARYTHLNSPHPSVFAMIALLLAQTAGWLAAAG